MPGTAAGTGMRTSARLYWATATPGQVAESSPWNYQKCLHG